MGDHMRKVIGFSSHLSGVLLATCRTHRGAHELMTHTSCLAQGPQATRLKRLVFRCCLQGCVPARTSRQVGRELLEPAYPKVSD